jgi:hypothetical protein
VRRTCILASAVIIGPIPCLKYPGKPRQTLGTSSAIRALQVFTSERALRLRDGVEQWVALGESGDAVVASLASASLWTDEGRAMPTR